MGLPDQANAKPVAFILEIRDLLTRRYPHCGPSSSSRVLGVMLVLSEERLRVHQLAGL